MKLIVGLANPGAQYLLTRHNVGSWYINLLINKYNLSLQLEKKFFGYTAYLNFFSNKIIFFIPNTFMNNSGQAVLAISNFYKIRNLSNILIAHDELYLPPGIARFKYNGGSAGHNGLKDIINKLSNRSDFYRLRIGIGNPGKNCTFTNFVLNKPLGSEKKLINDSINLAISCTEFWLIGKYLRAMDCLNSFKKILPRI